MNRLKDNIFAKIFIFIILQVSIVAASMSGVIIGVNAYMGWYSAGSNQVHESVLSDEAWNVLYEIHDRMYYEVTYNENDTNWHEYLLKDTEIPEGVGYELKFADEVADSDITDLSEISLKKNTKITKKYPDGYVSASLENDAYELTVYVADPYYYDVPVNELFPEDLAQRYCLQENVYQFRNVAIASGVTSLVIMILAFVFLVASIKKDREKRCFSDRVPLDLVCVIAIVLIACAAALIAEGLNMYYNLDLAVLVIASMIFAISTVFTGMVLFGILKVKRGEWWKSALTYIILKTAYRILKWLLEKIRSMASMILSGVCKLPLVWKTVAVIAVIVIINFALSVHMYWYSEALVLWILCEMVISIGVIYIALCMKKLKEGGERLAAGDLDYKVDKTGLFLDFAEHADALNSIGQGMALAVEEKTKSERLKAELITNVSHDIKTPLTSIINYVDFLKKEDIQDEKVQEYIEVLERQAHRLKRLTNDLVDASKASTGNVKIDLQPCQVGILMEQTLGEYKEKAEENELKFVVNVPEEDVEILADGRRLWRVFDNLLNNICKYSQPGTRVYIDLRVNNGKAEIMYRNTSKYELNIPAEELTGRFVRGDSSRHTEGSGLGLSIAQDLTELQGGTFELFIDGDLFKVIIRFDLMGL